MSINRLQARAEPRMATPNQQRSTDQMQLRSRVGSKRVERTLMGLVQRRSMAQSRVKRGGESVM